jgi:ABC-type branched-subunit amino acid transport system substrate-binding protein
MQFQTAGESRSSQCRSLLRPAGRLALSLLVPLLLAACVSTPAVREELLDARNHFDDREWQAALESIEDYLAQSPEGPGVAEAEYMRVVCLDELGESEQAIAAARRFQRRFPGDPLAWRALLRAAEIELRLNDEDAARELLLAVIQAYPRSGPRPDTAMWAAELLAAVDEPAAMKAYERFLRLDLPAEQRLAIERRLGALYERAGDHARAAEHREEALRLTDDPRLQARLLLALARNRLALGAVRESILSTAEAWELDPESIDESSETVLQRALKALTRIKPVDLLLRETPSGHAAAWLHLRRAELLLERDAYKEANREIRLALRPPARESVRRAGARLLALLEAAAESDYKRIGVLLPLSGRLAQFGHRALRGIQIAKAVARNEHPRISFDFVIRDTESNPERARELMQELVARQRVVAVIGPISSAEVRQSVEVADEYHVTMITPGAAEAGITSLSEYLFRDCPTREAEAAAFAEFVVRELNFERLAIMHPRSTYGRAMADSFMETALDLGADVAARSDYPTSALDFRTALGPLVRAYKSLKPEGELLVTQDDQGRPVLLEAEEAPIQGIFIPDFAKRAAMLIPQVLLQGIEGATLLGSSGWYSDELLPIAGEQAEGAYVITSYFPAPSAERFEQEYGERYDDWPHPLTVQTFEAGWILTQAIARGARSRESLRRALLEPEGLRGLFGPLRVDAEGNVVPVFFVLQVRRGKFEMIAELTPEDQ